MDRLQGAYAKKARINAAPPVPVREVRLLRWRAQDRSAGTPLTCAQVEGDLTLHGATAVYHNPRYSALAAVSQGPAQPLAGLTRVAAGANTPSGALEGHAMDSRAHQEQVNLSLRTGHAHDPDSGALVALHGDGSVFPPVAPARPAAKRAKGPDAADDAWLGPWAAHDAPVPGQLTLEQLEAIQRQYEAAQNNNAAEPAQNNIAAEDAEGPEVADPEAAETGVAGVAPARAAQRSRREAPGPTPSSRLLVSGAPDYLGRLWTHASGARGQTPAQCFAPRKRVAQCSTSSAAKGVTRLRWLPDTAHLLLSAAQDGCCRVWGWPNKKELAQYWGHDKGCKDACFTPDGLQFVSVGFDRRVVLWDVASARAPLTVSVPHMAYCCAVTARGDSVLVGCHDNHIYQYDLRSGALQQDYDRHLGPVNSVTLIEGGARFVSTSDDKTVRYWETGIGVDIKTHQVSGAGQCRRHWRSIMSTSRIIIP